MNNNFSDNIKKIRKEHNLSQEQLAEELGVSRQAISKWESGAAYPEMDKIISICKKYNCNIDDLLHSDLKEVKGEEETKNNINKYIDEFFKFITDSVNLFIRMKFGSKLKFLFEQAFIAFVLWILCLIIHGVLGLVVSHSPLNLLPFKIYNGITGFLGAIFALVAFIVCIIIMVRIYKARYLDYYEQEVVEKANIEDTSIEKKIEVDNNKISLKKENKIIVRDPKTTDHYFLNGLLKIFLIGIKFFVLWIELGLCVGLVTIGIGSVLSFLVYKTGFFFVGLLLGCLSSAVALSVIIILFFNFIFNRKSNKKLMIYSFVTSILVIGMSIGMVTVGSINFDIVNEPKEVKTNTFEIDMHDNSFLSHNYQIEYIIEDRPNIRVEIETDKQLTTTYNVNPNGNINFYNYAERPMELVREEIKGLNEKKIYPFYSDFNVIKVYANSSNIEKLKTNQNNYYDDIRNLNEENAELRDELDTTKIELENTKSELDSIKEQLNYLNENNNEEE